MLRDILYLTSHLYRYQVVDVKTAFEMAPEALTFDIAGALNTAAAIAADYVPGTDPNPVLVLQLLTQTDPHPSYAGHVEAYEL